jgi:hypothetical protein
MKTAILLLLAVTFACGADVHKEVKAQPGRKLDVNLKTGGGITVRGWDKDLVSVDVTFREDDQDRIDVEVEESGGGVSVTSRYKSHRSRHDSSPRFDIHVPARFDVELATEGGAFTVDGVEGTLSGKTMGGAIQLSKLKGLVDFHTMGGSITLTSSEVDGEVTTNGGKVKLEDVTGTVNGKTMGGSVDYRNVSEKSRSGAHDVVRISSMGGEINLDDAPAGADVSTMGGDVRVGSAGKFVKAKTMGGEINIEKVDGWVQAETMGGDVSVTMVGNPSEGKRDVDVSSLGGDVDLTLPAGISMTVDIDIKLSRGHRVKEARGHVESDFTVKREEIEPSGKDERWVSKIVHGSGVTGDGKNRVHITTVDGNVTIRKGK